MLSQVLHFLVALGAGAMGTISAAYGVARRRGLRATRLAFPEGATEKGGGGTW